VSSRSVKTEAVVLRSMRYGEADRILHLYTPHRGRVGAIAKGVRRARSRFGGRLEPFFRLHAELHEGRGELLTVTGAQTVDGHARLRGDARALDAAARACDAVGRLFETSEPHPGVFNLLCRQLALLDEQAGEGHDGTGVPGLELQGTTQRRLVTGGDQPVRLRRLRVEAVHEFLDLRLGDGTDEPVDHLTVPEGEHGRDRLDLERGRDPGVLVHVDLHQLDRAALGLDHLLQDGAEGPARPAPRGPEVHDDRDLLGAHENVLLEGGVGDVDHAEDDTGRGSPPMPLRVPRVACCP